MKLAAEDVIAADTSQVLLQAKAMESIGIRTHGDSCLTPLDGPQGRAGHARALGKPDEVVLLEKLRDEIGARLEKQRPWDSITRRSPSNSKH
ncbi:hypothetical protein ACFL6C_06860 [Myxococcota bacterium]